METQTLNPSGLDDILAQTATTITANFLAYTNHPLDDNGDDRSRMLDGFTAIFSEIRQEWQRLNPPEPAEDLEAKAHAKVREAVMASLKAETPPVVKAKPQPKYEPYEKTIWAALWRLLLIVSIFLFLDNYFSWGFDPAPFITYSVVAAVLYIFGRRDGLRY